MESPEAVIVAPLFVEIHTELISLLKTLSAEDWQKPTVCAGWSVKDVAGHLLGIEIGNLSGRRDGTMISTSIHGWDELVAYVNGWNQSWVVAARRISPRLLIDLLELTGTQMGQYFQRLDPFSMGGPVSWVGDEPAPVWLDLAREYTERWHHQQHIRDVVDHPGLKQPRYFSPVLAAFIRALPRTYATTTADENTSVTLTITGESGGRWSILRENGAWNLYSGAPEVSRAEVVVDQEIAWRLFTRGVNPDAVVKQIVVHGDPILGHTLLNMVSIIA